MGTHIGAVDIELGLARLGVFLAILLALLADRGYAEHVTLANRLSGFVARRAIDGVAVIGWVVDRLPQHATSNGGRDEQPTEFRSWARGL